eukprot:TRINITY_DN14560_c0_g1_i4.p1 TRINITY_DN14560_c0_g1~~TRINITY_DN14560_c0_g1_i4.p1  ORF type:complete len:502 (-),score=108.17 TRINITY_DN14560_c0_g1_i4:193-1698(-)
MAKHRIRAFFEMYDVHQVGICSREQLLSVLTEVDIQESEALAVLGQLSQSHGSHVCYGEFLDLLFGDDIPCHEHAIHQQEQEAGGEQHCGIDAGPFQQAEGATLTEQVDQEACRQQEARAQATNEVATTLQATGLAQALEEREAEWQELKMARRRSAKSATVKSLPDLTEVPYNIDFHYDLLVMGQAAAHLATALGVQLESGAHVQNDTQPPISTICNVFAEPPPDFSAERLETYLLSAECWGEESKAAKMQIRSCHNSKSQVPTSDTRAEADAAAALFLLSLPSAEDAEADPSAAQSSLVKEITTLKKMAGKYFEQRAPLLASLCCLIVFGEPPLPAQAAALAEKHSLSVVFLSHGAELQPVMSRLASLLPAAAEIKERRLAEQAVTWEALTDSPKGRELANKSSSLPRRDQFGTCFFSVRDSPMPGQKKFLCKSAYENEDDDDAESWMSFGLSNASSAASSRSVSRSTSMNGPDVANAGASAMEAVEALRKAGLLQSEE